MKPALCIVVPVLDEAQTLVECLQNLQPFRRRGARVVVVDGGSVDDTRAIARGIATGDQAIFVRQDRFTQVGGFPDIPLMEDIALSRFMRGFGTPA